MPRQWGKSGNNDLSSFYLFRKDLKFLHIYGKSLHIRPTTGFSYHYRSQKCQTLTFLASFAAGVWSHAFQSFVSFPDSETNGQRNKANRESIHVWMMPHLCYRGSSRHHSKQQCNVRHWWCWPCNPLCLSLERTITILSQGQS